MRVSSPSIMQRATIKFSGLSSWYPSTTNLKTISRDKESKLIPQRIQKSPLPDDVKKVSINVADLTMAHKPRVRKKFTYIHEYNNNDSDKEDQAPLIEETATATYEEETAPTIEDYGAVAVTNPEKATVLPIEDEGAEKFREKKTFVIKNIIDDRFIIITYVMKYVITSVITYVSIR